MLSLFGFELIPAQFYFLAEFLLDEINQFLIIVDRVVFPFGLVTDGKRGVGNFDFFTNGFEVLFKVFKAHECVKEAVQRLVSGRTADTDFGHGFLKKRRDFDVVSQGGGVL